MSAFEFTVPVLVVGGGACGAVAALAAHEAGAGVLLIEQDGRPMGSSGMSQGLICAAGTKAQSALGVVDGPEVFYADIMAKTRGLADPAVARALADRSGAVLDWLVEAQAMPWQLDEGFRPSYGNSTFRVHGWMGHDGQAMVDLLHARIDEAGIDRLLDARLSAVIAGDDGRVEGVEITRPDGALEQIGCETLILACGGFAANHAMVAQHIPEMAQARNNGHEGSRGDAIRFGTQLGAALGDMGSYQGYAMLTDPQGITVPPGILVDGGILVNAAGQRFVDETADIAGMVHAVLAQPSEHAWVLFDEHIEGRCAYIPETKALIELNAMRKAASLAEMADKIGLPVDALAATMAEIDTARAVLGLDRFGRSWGVDTPPTPEFRALRVVGALYHTQGGLQIDQQARVLREDGSALPNLFAGGGAARSVSGPSSWGYLPAMGLCTAVTLGHIAGTSAARQVLGGD